jgi:DNA-binding transcriptional regulator YiaG
MVSEREKLVCARLRAFRDFLDIPRSRFAVALGYGTERIASYEAGRAPIRYEVFRAASVRYHLSPQWLATGAASPKLWGPFDDSPFIESVTPRSLFTAVYDRFIAGLLSQQQAQLAEALKLRAAPPPRLRSQLLDYWASVEALAKEKQRKLKVSGPDENTLLTQASTCGIMPSVKAQLDNLLARLNRLTQEPGKKTELADFLSAPLASVSRWLSGKRDPGGETTLKLLRWVQEQESQPNTLGSAINTTKGKTQLRSSKVYEKTKSNPHKG